MLVSDGTPIIDDLGMRKLPHTAAEDLLELIMRRYERASTILTSIAPSMTGASCSATPRPSRRCSIACSTTRTCSLADRAAGARNSTRPPTPRAHSPLTSLSELTPHAFHGDWNYTLQPRVRTH